MVNMNWTVSAYLSISWARLTFMVPVTFRSGRPEGSRVTPYASEYPTPKPQSTRQESALIKVDRCHISTRKLTNALADSLHFSRRSRSRTPAARVY